MSDLDILGFNPADLKVFATPETSSSSTNLKIYKPKPADSKSEDGVYRATIRVIYNPFDFKDSIVETQTYAMQDAEGWFTATSLLTNNDTSCPIFKAWKSYHFSQDPVKKKIADSKENGGPGYFDKRYARYVTVQVIEDKNNPDLENKYLVWKMPKAIYDLITAKMNPSPESKKAQIPVMDILFGRTIDLEITPGPDDAQHPERKQREIKYTSSEITDDIVTCKFPDGKDILNADEQDVLNTYVDKMSKVWKCKDAAERATMVAEINADPNTAKLKDIYRKALDTLKGFCPNVREEVGYKPWDEALTKRVNAYLAAIANGQDPKTIGQAPAVADTIGVVTDAGNTATPTAPTAPTSVVPPTTTIAPSVSDNDELPF